MQKEKDKRFKNVIKSLLKINKNIIIKSILLSIFYIIMTILFNFPMAFFWQICYCGPFVRWIFGKLFH